MKYLMKAVGIAKSTYYFEIKKEDVVANKNAVLMDEIREIFMQIRVDME